MPETPRPNGADPQAAAEPIEPPRKSLREVAEDAYDEVIEASDDGAPESQVDGDGQPRDAQGRFAPRTQSAEPGVAAEGTQPPPSPEDPNKPPAQQQDAHPAPEGRSSEPPANWSAADRETFAKLAPEGREFLLRRHSEMEGDYQRRVQANAAAAEFAQTVAPYFQDPMISENLRAANWSPARAVVELLGFHRRAIGSPEERAGLLQEMMQRLLPGIDPAAVFGQSRSGQSPAQLSEQEMADPAIRYFAEHVSQTAQQVQALRGQIVSMQQAEAARTNAEALKVTKWGIDSFASEKDAQGNLKRPDFDVVLPQIIELFQANPNRDLNEAYQQARWMHPASRERLIAAERQTVQQQASNSRARQAVRVNARGVTSPVSKPADANGSKSLRETLESTADEIGFG
jgi:hypothetical protein